MLPPKPPVQELSTLRVSWRLLAVCTVPPEGVEPDAVPEVDPDVPVLPVEVDVPDEGAGAFCDKVVRVCCALAAVMTEATQGAPLKVQLLSTKEVSRTPVPLKPSLITELAARPELQLGEVKV
jgi:hypothetical protein